MREIKFRAWHKERKEMVEVETIHLIGPYGPEGRSGNDWIQPHGSTELWSVQSVELMEYTGAKDANGKEIYEGDIIKLANGYSVHAFKDKRVAIDLEDGLIYGCEPFIEFAGAGWQGEHSEDVEVIGNIYEHPELLQEEGKL